MKPQNKGADYLLLCNWCIGYRRHRVGHEQEGITHLIIQENALIVSGQGVFITQILFLYCGQVNVYFENPAKSIYIQANIKE